MHRFNLLIAISIVVMSFASCSTRKMQMIGTNYEFRKDYFSIDIIYENQTDRVLVFPYVYFTSCFHSIYEEKRAIVIDECNTTFNNLDEMVALQLKGSPVNENDDMSYLNLLAIPSGHKFIYSSMIPYSRFPKQKILDKGQIEILMDFGIAKEIEYDNSGKTIASGPIKKYKETIKLVDESRNELGKLPVPSLFPFCDLEDCIYIEKNNEPFTKHH